VIGIVDALRLQIGSRVASLRDPLSDLYSLLATSRLIAGIAGTFEIALNWWILFLGISRANGALLIVFAVYFVFLLVYGIVGLPGHQAVYNTLGHYLMEIVPVTRKLAGPANQVIGIARNLYPFGFFEKRKE
jgi:hypothetical protein